jgi:Glycosyl transferase family 2
MKLNDLTIAIATYNGEPYVSQAIASALRTGAQVVVSDDGSTDSTREQLARFASQVEIVLHPSNRGIASNYQFLLERCETPLMWLLNQDDVILAGPPAATRYSDSRVTILNGWRLDSNGQRQRLIYRRPPFHSTIKGVYKALRIENFAMSPSQVIFPTHRALETGGFIIPDARGQGAEDWMCWLRLASMGLRFVLRLRPAMAYRLHASNYSQQSESHQASRQAVRRAFPSSPERDHRLRIRW